MGYNNQLLIHCDGADGSTTFTDISDSAHTITPNSNAEVDTAQKKFGTGSLFLDTTSDYLSIPDSEDWNFEDENFTVDFWWRPATLSNNSTLIRQDQGSSAFNISFSSSNGLGFNLGFDDATFDSSSQGSTSGWSTLTWYHIALVRYGNLFTLYRNGQYITSLTSTKVLKNQSAPLIIGDIINSNQGHFDEIRVNKGAAVWTTDFEPPTEAYKGDKDPGYEILLHCDGINTSTDFPDDGSYNHSVTAEGFAKVDTTYKKFGTGSLRCQTTGSYLVIPASVGRNLKDGDFTIDFWQRTSDNSHSSHMLNQVDNYPNNTWQFFRSSSGLNDNFNFQVGGGQFSSFTLEGTTSPANDTWYHIAVVRSGTTFTLYINGTAEASTTNKRGSMPDVYHDINFGGRYSSTSGGDGWYDELRIVKEAVWTSNFTPDTNPYTPPDVINRFFNLYTYGPSSSIGDLPVFQNGFAGTGVIADLNQFRYGIATDSQYKYGTNFSGTISSAEFFRIYDGQYAKIQGEKIYGRSYFANGEYNIDFFADSGRLYKTLNYSSPVASGENILASGTMYGYGIYCRFSYNF